jgi:hypothetical protein
MSFLRNRLLSNFALPRQREDTGIDGPLPDPAHKLEGTIEVHPGTAAAAPVGSVKIKARNVDVFYADNQAIYDVSIDIPDRAVTAFIGPSGCGKSTFLRCMNRMNDTIPIARVHGSIDIDGENINNRDVDPVVLRSRVGMVFQKPNPFRSRSSRTSPTARASTAWWATRTSSTAWSSPPCARPACGTRCPIASTSRAPACRAASSSAWSSLAPSR